MNTGQSSLYVVGSARRPWRAGLAFALVCVAGSAFAAPPDFDLDQPCTAALPMHTFNARAGTAFEGRIGLLNGDGKRIFWAFLSPPTAGFGGPSCSEASPGAAFRCGDVTIALPAGSPKSSVPDRESARLSGIPATSGAINFSLIIQEDGANGASCERSYLLKISAANPDIVPPTVPQGLHAVNEAPGRPVILVHWAASTDTAGGAVTYLLESCGGEDCDDFSEVHRGKATRFTHRRLPLDAEFRYRVCALDAAGNRSAFSAVASAHTFISHTPH